SCVRPRSRFRGQSEPALRDDVFLNLARAGVDGVGAGEQEQALKGAELVRLTGQDLSGQAEHVHREIAELLVPRRPEELRDQRLATELSALRAAQRAQRIQPHDLELHRGTGQPLADYRIATLAVGSCGGDQRVELVLEGKLLPERG